VGVDRGNNLAKVAFAGKVWTARHGHNFNEEDTNWRFSSKGGDALTQNTPMLMTAFSTVIPVDVLPGNMNGKLREEISR
jgi:hypothetical protein